MASIVNRGKSYSVVYSLKTDTGHKQKWETYHTLQEAEHRRQQVEFYLNQEKKKRACVVETVSQLLDEYIRLYGLSKWSMSTYEGNCSLIRNYIIPFMGSIRLSELSPRIVAELYRKLLEFPQIDTLYHRSRGKSVTPRLLESIHKVLHSAFEQAVLWEYVRTNPFHKAILPKVNLKKVQLLSAGEIKRLLQCCHNQQLRVVLHLAFAGSLRKGEILALTWDDINFNTGSVEVCKTLSRVSKEALIKLNHRDIIHQFPAILSSEKSVVVLKTPKTHSSIRTVYLPRYVINELLDLKKQRKETKNFPDMLFQYSDGRPLLESTLSNHFRSLLAAAGLPQVTFHSLRHSSITYKLVLSQGNIKAVQGDSGHAQAEMVTELYGHIMDESRKENAIRFEEDFYQNFK